MSKLFKPTVDSIFKKIFGENEEVCINFLNSIFRNKNEPLVKSLTFQNTEINGDIEDAKDCKLDVRAVIDDGSTINIEVQVSPQNYYVRRSAFYWAQMYTDQIGSGGKYYALQRCVCINRLLP